MYLLENNFNFFYILRMCPKTNNTIMPLADYIQINLENGQNLLNFNLIINILQKI